jgi:hypothetical protein
MYCPFIPAVDGIERAIILKVLEQGCLIFITHTDLVHNTLNKGCVGILVAELDDQVLMVEGIFIELELVLKATVTGKQVTVEIYTPF